MNRSPYYGVVCRSCPWRGNRVYRDDEAKLGTCPKCGAKVERVSSAAERRMAKAKADLAVFGHA